MSRKFAHPLFNIEAGCFNSSQGITIDILNPDKFLVDIQDIANALSKICRWGGHCREFYSVAQHSVVVAAMADNSCRLEALMHDAQEAYVQDIVSPLKKILEPIYKPIEDKWEAVIAEVYNLDPKSKVKIKPLDMAVLQMEFDYLMLGDKHKWEEQMQSIGLKGGTWTPQEAYDQFRKCFNENMRF